MLSTAKSLPLTMTCILRIATDRAAAAQQVWARRLETECLKERL